MANGSETLRESAAPVAGPLSGRLWKNGRFQKKVMLEAVGAFTQRERPELFDSAHADAGEPGPGGYRTSVTTNENLRRGTRRGRRPTAVPACSTARLAWACHSSACQLAAQKEIRSLIYRNRRRSRHWSGRELLAHTAPVAAHSGRGRSGTRDTLARARGYALTMHKHGGGESGNGLGTARKVPPCPVCV